MKPGDSLTAVEVAVVAKAMDWYERQWPFDPEKKSFALSPFFPEVRGEVLPPKVEVHHFDGWRIGWITVEDGISRFVRDYKEDPA